jgi:hypothetical protein
MFIAPDIADKLESLRKRQTVSSLGIGLDSHRPAPRLLQERSSARHAEWRSSRFARGS